MVSSLIEILVVTIGHAIAKSLVKIWLKDTLIGETVTESILDLLKGKTSDLIAARKGSRLFEEVGDKVAKSLEPTFLMYEAEAELDVRTQKKKLSFSVVAEAVAFALDTTVFTPKLLASLSNDPYKLLDFIKKNNDVPKGLNEVEIALFNRSLELSCQYIIDLSRNLPDYTSSNFTEILKRMDTFVEQLNRVISDLDQLRAASDINFGVAKANFENNYREAIVRNLNHVELLGLEFQHFGRRYPLSIAYVSLDVSAFRNAEEYSFLSSNRQRVEIALSNSKYSIISGEAGSGKTTLLRWLAVNSAANKFEKEMSKWIDTIPFYIELRRFTDEFPAPEHFLDKVVPEIAGMMPLNWSHEIMLSRNTLLLIDGIDEITTKKRSDLYDWISNLAHAFPKMKIVVASRPAAYNRNYFKRT